MKQVLAALVLCALSFAAFAIEPFTVRDIHVEGLHRISAGTVFNYLPVKVGDTLNDQTAQEAIRALFKTGFFNDVQLERRGDVLIVKVVERPSIDSVDISGSREISESDLKKSLKQIGLAEGRVFNRSLLEQVEQEIKRQYFARGYYGVRVDSKITELPRNRVSIKLDIAEGRAATIRQINIVGNHVFTDKDLLSRFQLSTPTFFSFITKNDQYSKEKLTSDLESLRSYYQNQGYLEFAVQSTQVQITPDKESIYVTINVKEGPKYTISGFRLAGKLILPEAELRKLVEIKPGDVFSRQAVTDSAKKIGDRLGNEGYAFANVNPIPEVDKEKRTVFFTFFVDPGHRVYVRRVNFSGNIVTRDEVLRREMRQFEGAWYSAEKIQRSLTRLRRLGFFDEVSVETPPVPGSPDQVDVNITVKERPTGTLMAGVGYSDADGLLLNASVNFKNFLGTGREFSVGADNSSAVSDYHLRYVNPYYTQNGVSRGIYIYRTHVNAAQENLASYSETLIGASVFYDIPISEDRTFSVGIGWENAEFDVNSTSAQVAQDFVAANGKRNNIIKGTIGWSYDTLNSRLFPTSGILHRVSAEVGLPGADLEYYKLTYDMNYYIPLGKSYTWKFRSTLGYGNGYGGTGSLPFYKNFFAGGSSTVRGFRARSLGPRDILPPNDPIGGSKLTVAGTELMFPVPGVKDSTSMRLSVFFDAGQVYGPSQAVDLGELRYSTGLAFNWFSPIGPLSLSFGVPLNKKPGDNTESVQFTLGTTFQ